MDTFYFQIEETKAAFHLQAHLHCPTQAFRRRAPTSHPSFAATRSASWQVVSEVVFLVVRVVEPKPTLVLLSLPTSAKIAVVRDGVSVQTDKMINRLLQATRFAYPQLNGLVRIHFPASMRLRKIIMLFLGAKHKEDKTPTYEHNSDPCVQSFLIPSVFLLLCLLFHSSSWVPFLCILWCIHLLQFLKWIRCPVCYCFLEKWHGFEWQHRY